MQFLRYLQKHWNIPLLHIVVILAIAVIFAAYESPSFLGAYLLLLGEFAAGVLVVRSGERRNRIGHLIVVAVVMIGTFAVLVSLSTCDPAYLALGKSCSPVRYWLAFQGLSSNVYVALLIVLITIPVQYKYTGSRQID